MRVELINPDHDTEEFNLSYEILKQWWIKRHRDPPVRSSLPKLGAFVSDEDRHLCAGFLYLDNSVGVSFLHHIVTNPSNGAGLSRKCVGILIDFLLHQAREFDYTLVIATVENEVLRDEAKQLGFWSDGHPRYELVTYLN